MKFALRASEVCLAYEVHLRCMKCADAHVGKFHFMSEGHFMAKPLHIVPAILHFPQSFLIFPLDKSEIHAIITKSLRHNRISGGVPEWPKGTDCKSAAFRFDGSNPSSPTRKKPDATHQAFFNEARLAAHEACCAHEAMLRIMKNEFSPARFASCPKDASCCVSNASFFFSSRPLYRTSSMLSYPHNNTPGGSTHVCTKGISGAHSDGGHRTHA